MPAVAELQLTADPKPTPQSAIAVAVEHAPPLLVPTIFAVSSAPGRAGVAVVRISGPRAGDALDRVCRLRPEDRRAALRVIRDPSTGGEIDRGIVLWMPGPGTFTGEDTAELHVHGGRAVIRALLAALGGIGGCRPAEAGEFALQAFRNGRIDLTAAEGLADLIDAETEAQRRQALAQSAGVLAQLYEGWRTTLIEAHALVAAAIDFSDEADVSDRAVAEAEAAAGRLLAGIERHLADGHRGEILRDGYRVVLAGPPNAGKSSLLNALARRDAAIVSDEAGTTRDIIEVRLDLGGYPVIVSDTAGLRTAEAAGSIEREGMRRTLESARVADLVLWLDDGRSPGSSPDDHLAVASGAVWRIASKADLAMAAGSPVQPGVLAVSARTGVGLDDLQRRIAAAAGDAVGNDSGEAPLTQDRHRRQLEATATALQSFTGNRDAGLELRAEDLRIAADALGRITGRIDVEDVLGAVFGRFCIGK